MRLLPQELQESGSAVRETIGFGACDVMVWGIRRKVIGKDFVGIKGVYGHGARGRNLGPAPGHREGGHSCPRQPRNEKAGSLLRGMLRMPRECPPSQWILPSITLQGRLPEVVPGNGARGLLVITGEVTRPTNGTVPASQPAHSIEPNPETLVSRTVSEGWLREKPAQH